MAIKTSKTAEARFAQYKTSKTQATNRLRKLMSLAKKQPNNLQIVKAMDAIVYRRCTPKTTVWSHQMIATAKLMKYFTGKFDKNVFHADPKLQLAAAMSRDPNKFLPQVSKAVLYAQGTAKQHTSKESMFSIGAQLRSKEWK